MNCFIELINKIFPRGYDAEEERFGRYIAEKLGYNVICDLEQGLVETVDIGNIIPCQQIISKTKIIEFMLYLMDNDVPGYPAGIRVNDVVYLIDGHHRVSAQILQGSKSVIVHTVDISSEYNLLAEARNHRVYNKNSFTKTIE